MIYAVPLNRWRWLFIALVVGCGALGAWLALVSSDLLTQAAGLVALAAGVGAAVAAPRIYRRTARVGIALGGIVVPLAGGGLGWVPWGDIESFNVVREHHVAYTGIRLRQYGAFLASLGPGSVQGLLDAHRPGGAITALVTVFGLSQLEDPSRVIDDYVRGHQIADPVDVLDKMRERYGAEILIDWLHRDRSAAKFAAFLETSRASAIRAAEAEVSQEPAVVLSGSSE